MEFFLTNEDKLDFSWHPGCSYIGSTVPGWSNYTSYPKKYSVGPIGRIGPGCPGPSAAEIAAMPPNTEVPSALQLTIRLKENNKELFDGLTSLLKEQEGLPNNDIEVDYPKPKCTKTKLSVKLDHVQEVAYLMKKNKRAEKIRKYVERLKKLGYHCDHSNAPCNGDYEGCDYHCTHGMSVPETAPIPEEYFNWNEAYDYRVGFTVCCYDGTEFYKYLSDKGIFEKYYPEWYKNNKY